MGLEVGKQNYRYVYMGNDVKGNKNNVSTPYSKAFSIAYSGRTYII
jgi:hypothetical protein